MKRVCLLFVLLFVLAGCSAGGNDDSAKTGNLFLDAEEEMAILSDSFGKNYVSHRISVSKKDAINASMEQFVDFVSEKKSTISRYTVCFEDGTGICFGMQQGFDCVYGQYAPNWSIKIEYGTLVFDENSRSYNYIASFEEISEPIGTRLFEDVYVPYASKEKSNSFIDVKEDVSRYAEQFGLICEIEEATAATLGKLQIFDERGKDGDYAFFQYCFIGDTNDQRLMMISYYCADSKSEVALTNLSDSGDANYDKLTTRIIGNSDEIVPTIAAQRAFLFSE